MKRILITGGSHAELPLIERAAERGMYVITTGSNSDGLGHKKADKYVCGDFSDKEFVLWLAKKENADGIISGCNDFAYLSTAYACEKLGLKGHDSYETACVIHHKDKFRQLTAELGIRTPRTAVCRSEAETAAACESVGLPAVVKPTDLTGGKGVRVCQSADEAAAAYVKAAEATRRSSVIVEEYITGTNHGASLLLKNGKAVAGICDNEKYYLNKYLVSGAYFPPDIPCSTVVRLYADVERIAARLNLADGLFHCQFIAEKDGCPVIIDPCRRAPGDLYILFAKYATGIDFPDAILSAELGETLRDSYTASYSNVARMCVMTDSEGFYGGISFDPTVSRGIFDKLIWAKEGEAIDDHLKYKAGIVFLKYPDYAALRDAAENFHSYARINVKEKKDAD